MRKASTPPHGTLAESDIPEDSRIAELEERLDFAERLLTQVQARQYEGIDEIIKEATPD